MNIFDKARKVWIEKGRKIPADAEPHTTKQGDTIWIVKRNQDKS